MTGRETDRPCRALRSAWRYPAAFGIVTISTLLSEILYRIFDTTRLSMVFLAGVLVVAVMLGSGPAYFAAALAFVVYNIYLVEPRFTFQLVSPEDVLVLVVFGAVAVLTGRLAGRVRDEAKRNESRARTTAALFEASRDLSSIDDEWAIRHRLAGHIGEAAKAQAAVWDAAGAPLSPTPEGLPDQAIAEARRFYGAQPTSELETFQAGDWRFRALRAKGENLGIAGWRATEASAGLVEEQLITVLVDIGAAAVTRARLADARAEAEATARTEQLRNALLSSISHDLRTPLAAILASASSLREFDGRFTASVRADLVLTIEEEAERLNRFVANLLNMTKLESGALSITPVLVDVVEVIDRLLQRLERRLGSRTLQRAIGGGGLTILGDPIMVEQAVTNVLENALRFSPDGSVIALMAARRGNSVLIEVTDEGPGVPTKDLGLIFEKFYRSPTTASELQGTGLGLSITQGLLAAMGGEVRARGRADDRPGLVVALTLPLASP